MIDRDRPPTGFFERALNLLPAFNWEKRLAKHFETEFTHDGKSYLIRVAPNTIDVDTQNIKLRFTVQSADQPGSEFARIAGTLVQTPNGRAFKVISSNNRTTPNSLYYNPDLPETKGLTGAAIANLVQERKVAEWLSDLTLSEGAKKMYERLTQNPNLEVRKIPITRSSDNFFQYSVRLKNPPTTESGLQANTP